MPRNACVIRTASMSRHNWPKHSCEGRCGSHSDLREQFDIGDKIRKGLDSADSSGAYAKYSTNQTANPANAAQNRH